MNAFRNLCQVIVIKPRISPKRFIVSLPTATMEEELLEFEQRQALEEKCFLVNEQDRVVGVASKRDCHSVQNNKIPLHRAFSVFLFNQDGDLLLQRRSERKITYPDYYTNTCCSHPLAEVPGEEDEENALGIKRAALRRLHHELGIAPDAIALDEMKYLTRIHYFDPGNGKWGEHEIDYILFIQKNVELKPNLNEVSEVCYIPRNEINNILPKLKAPLTPWFHLIVKHRLGLWWDNLNNLDPYIEHKKILKFEP